MPFMSESDLIQLKALLYCIAKIEQSATDHKSPDELAADEESLDAILMNFIVIGETIERISETLRLQNPLIPWTQIKGFRNVIAHDYFGVDVAEVWSIIKIHLPQFQHNIRVIINQNPTTLP